MSGYLGPALKAITMGRQGVLAGRDKTREYEQEARQMELRMALQEQARQQEIAERKAAQEHRAAVLGETQRHNQAVESRPVAGPSQRIDPLSEAGIAASIQKAKGIRGVPTYGQANPKPKASAAAEETTLADGTVVQGKPPKSTEGERKAAALLGIAEDDIGTLDDMSASLPQKALGKIPAVGNILLGKFDEEYQAQRAAGERFVDQWLRFTSGAQITESEREKAYQLFVPEPGDKPEKLRAKSQARQNALAGLKKAAGSLGGGAEPAPSQIPSGMNPTAIARGDYLNDADYWEMLKGEGMTDAAATAKVLARKNKKKK